MMLKLESGLILAFQDVFSGLTKSKDRDLSHPSNAPHHIFSYALFSITPGMHRINESTVTQALADLADGQFDSLRAAEAAYGVNRTTLSRRRGVVDSPGQNLIAISKL